MEVVRPVVCENSTPVATTAGGRLPQLLKEVEGRKPRINLVYSCGAINTLGMSSVLEGHFSHLDDRPDHDNIQ